MAQKIEKRGENSYRFSVAAGYGADGKQLFHRKTVHCTEKEVEKQYGLFLAEIEKGQVATSGKMTLNEFLDYWLKNYAEVQQAPKTIAYNKGLFKRIREALGHKRLDQIEPKHLLAFYANLREPIKVVRKKQIDPDTPLAPEYLSPNTIHKYHVLLHSLFEKATKWQFTAYNIVEKVEAPKTVKPQQEIYDEETTGKFLLLLASEEIKHQVMALLPLATGMRRGETLGLQWKHLDLDRGIITIEQAGQYLPGIGVFTKDPKTKTSNRIVTLPLSLVPILKKYKTVQTEKRLKLGLAKNGGKWIGAEEPEDDFIFVTWNGRQAHPDSINTWLKKFIQKNNLPHLTPKGFRHMAATYLITSGTDLRTVAGKLGHANSTTTQIVYSHLLKSAEAETANKMDSFLQETTGNAINKQNQLAK